MVSDDEQLFRAGLSRRGFLAVAGAIGVGAAAAPLLPH
ncbi:MAG TPA: twin-arginine translocation signal domain-containing protein [Jatrophihabitans sp.]|jgi:hypothetical protein|nr:twin-arginine translocation signal domain-containing protein [Jatrophihabitans sp.]